MDGGDEGEEEEEGTRGGQLTGLRSGPGPPSSVSSWAEVEGVEDSDATSTVWREEARRLSRPRPSADAPGLFHGTDEEESF